ncbi:MAG: anhydro-N-acetylmuramic acid kinase [Pelagibacterales bacterium]|nr:anhydro-N-acetylmuramic acid kinase [Pelagibacterales bacterium]
MKTRDKYSYFVNSDKSSINALGLMSGTSLDGVDIALIKTDGNEEIILKYSKTYPYNQSLVDSIKTFINSRKNIKKASLLITKFHAKSINSFIKNYNLNSNEIDIIGFHGQTIFHSPNQKWTWQMGDGKYLSSLVRIPVISNFRYRDICLGGQGAPLIGIWHKALLNNLNNIKYPCVFLNIGGVSNITYIEQKNNIPYSFDIGIGNGPLDFIMQKFYNKNFDKNGKISLFGEINYQSLNNILNDPWFKKNPPKSIDKNYLNNLLFLNINHLNPEDQAATISRLITMQLKESFKFFSLKPNSLYVSGGGVKNLAMMKGISEGYSGILLSLDDNNWNADAMEAQAFAYLAVKSIKSLPYTFNKTTGVNAATSGGLINFPIM